MNNYCKLIKKNLPKWYIFYWIQAYSTFEECCYEKSTDYMTQQLLYVFFLLLNGHLMLNETQQKPHPNIDTEKLHEKP